jgi:hypothetical protein
VRYIDSLVIVLGSPSPYVNNSHAFTRRRNGIGSYSYRSSGYLKSYAITRRSVKSRARCFFPSISSQSLYPTPSAQCKTRKTHYSRNVNRFVCRIFIALSASRSSITQDMLISLAPVTKRISLAMSAWVFIYLLLTLRDHFDIHIVLSQGRKHLPCYTNHIPHLFADET